MEATAFFMEQKIITKDRTFACTRSEAWRKWTTHEGLRTFFGKDNWMELRIGGPFEIYFFGEQETGLRGSEGCTVLGFLPEEMLSFTWNVPPQFAEVRASGFQNEVVVTFEPAGENQVRIRITHSGWPEGEVFDEIFSYFERAWDVALGWFEDSLQKQ